MLLVGVVWLMAKKIRTYILASLAGLAVCSHVFNAARYAATGEMQRQCGGSCPGVRAIGPETALIVQLPNVFRYPGASSVGAGQPHYYPQESACHHL
jgi:hypothetical protein